MTATWARPRRTLAHTARRTARRAARAATALALAAGLAGCLPIYKPMPATKIIGELAVDSVLAACPPIGTRTTVTANTHLDPACTYSGVLISTSNVVLDCRGGRIIDPPGGQAWQRGIEISAPVTTALTGVTVRNCYTEGFTNGLRVTRPGFKTLAAGSEYDVAFSNIRVENSWFHKSNGSGVFVDGYVTGVTLRSIEVTQAGSVGVYLEAGSKDNVIELSYIHGNGFADADPAGQPKVIGGTTFMYQGTGREGIAVDGSRNNVIRGNVITANSAGGIFFYKNCGEFATQEPAQHWTRRYGADGNLVELNVISNEHTGVWLGSRMAENQTFMDCSDPAYVDVPFKVVHLDHAAGNTIRNNSFETVEIGVHIEDDGNLVDANRFASPTSTHRAIVVGTRERFSVLGLPTDGSTITGNVSEITGNTKPFTWVHGHTNTTFTGNLRGTRAATLAAGTAIPSNPFLMVLRIWVP